MIKPHESREIPHDETLYLPVWRRPFHGYVKPISTVLLSWLLGFLTYEWIKELLLPDLTKWESHTITLIVGAVAVIVTTYLVLRKTITLYRQTLEENIDHTKTEEELRRTKEWFRSLTEHGTDLITVIDPKGTILYDSPSAERILGYRPIDRLGKSGFDLVHPEDVSRAKHIIGLAFQKLGSTHTIEMRVRGQDGRWRWFESTGKAILDHEGKLRGVINSRDISERKQAQEALRQKEEYFRSLTENIQDIISILNPDGTITYESPSIERVLGYRPEEVVGRNAFEFIHQEDRPHVLEAIAKVLGSPGSTASTTFRFQGKDRAWRYLESVGKSLAGASGSLIIIVTSRDISERRQAEEKLRLQTAALQATVNGMVITDQNGAVVWVNPAFTAMTGYSAEEVVGQNPRLLKSGFQDPSFYANLWSTITSGRSWHGELVNKRKDGSFYTDEMTITPVRDTQGNITHFIAIKRDITERKQLEKQARQVSRLAALGQLIGGIAHEMKNPLFILTGRIQMAREKLAHQEYAALESDMKKIDEAGERMKTIADRFMTIAKPVPPHQEQCSIQAILHKSIESLANELTQNRIRVETAFAPDLPGIQSDPRQLYEVFLNLMQNAVQAMTHVQGERRLTVSAAREGTWVVARIQDNGPGIAPEHRAKLFEPFFSTAEQGKGPSLGHWIVRSTLMMLKGEVLCESEVGKGSTFIVRLPIGEEKSKP